jgi:small ubiquitin-related modifier
MRKVFSKYAERKGLDPSTLRFMFEGDPLNGDETPESLEMEDDCVVDVFAEQVGGWF